MAASFSFINKLHVLFVINKLVRVNGKMQWLSDGRRSLASHLSRAGLPVSVAAGEVAAAHARVDYVRHVLHCALRDRPPGGRRAGHVRRLLLRQGRRHLRLCD